MGSWRLNFVATLLTMIWLAVVTICRAKAMPSSLAFEIDRSTNWKGPGHPQMSPGRCNVCPTAERSLLKQAFPIRSKMLTLNGLKVLLSLTEME